MMSSNRPGQRALPSLWRALMLLAVSGSFAAAPAGATSPMVMSSDASAPGIWLHAPDSVLHGRIWSSPGSVDTPLLR